MFRIGGEGMDVPVFNRLVNQGSCAERSCFAKLICCRENRFHFHENQQFNVCLWFGRVPAMLFRGRGSLVNRSKMELGRSHHSAMRGVTTMAKIIEFQVPPNHKSVEHWVPPRLRGRMIDFQARSEYLQRMFEERLRVVSTLSRNAG